MEEFKSEYSDMVNSSKTPEKRVRKFQAIVYALGLILAIVSFTEFYYGNILQNQIGEYEKKVDEFEILRGNVLDLEERYTEIWFDLMQADLTAYLQIENSLISSAEANLLIFSQVLTFQITWFAFIDLFFPYYDDEDIQWLFTEGIFDFRYNGYDDFYSELQTYYDYYSDLPDGDELDDWSIWVYSADKYWYSETHSLLISVMPYYPVDIYANIEIFDEYVAEHYLTPLNGAKATLIALQISTNSNTVGILILSFIMNFEDVTRKWRAIYVLLATFSLLSGSVMTTFVFFGL